MSKAATAPIRGARPMRVLFARVSWMTSYAGPEDNLKPIGGGKFLNPTGVGNFVKKHGFGHELFNFANFDGRCYGFVGGLYGRLRLDRVEPIVSNQDKLDRVLVIFVSRQRMGQVIVGWYVDATVHAEEVMLPAAVKQEMKDRVFDAGIKGVDPNYFYFEVPYERAFLLEFPDRQYPIPAGKGGFGKSNVCYPYETDGTAKKYPWIDAAIQYVREYEKENSAVLTTAASIAKEQQDGFQSNVEIRSKVEHHAMSKAIEALRDRGYTEFRPTWKSKPYDYTCVKAGVRYYVEVKGTQTSSKAIFLTRNEVEHAKRNPETSILVIVHSIKVSTEKGVLASGGIPDVRTPWRLDPAPKPIQFVWAAK